MVRAQPEIRDAAMEEIRRLAQVRVDDGCVLSVFVDLDHGRFATPAARESQFRSLLLQAQESIADGGLDEARRAGLRDDIERVRAYLGEPDTEGVEGLAIFSCSPVGLFEVLRLEEPVEHRVEVAPTPWVEPLVRHAAASGWCLLLVNRRAARVLRGSVDRLREVEDVQDVVHRQHKQGGWSQARYERSVETDVDRHLDHVNRMMMGLADRHPFERLLVAGPEELVPRMEEALHASIRSRLAGRFSVDVEHSTREEVLERARPAMEDVERRTERELLDRLADRLGAGGRAVAGVEDTFAALIDQRVGDVLIGADEGWGEAISLAAAQAADVHVVRYHDDVERLGGIAALLRF